MTRPWVATSGGLRLSVRLTPRGGRDAIDGIEELADAQVVLKVRVRAAPSDGEANAALIALLSRGLAVPRSTIALLAGGAARRKTLLISGDASLLAQRLEQILASG